MKRRSSKENGVVGISCKKGRKRSMLMSPLIRLPNAKPPKKHKKGITVLSPLNKSAFFCLFHWIFINVLIISQKFCIVLAAFVSFVECGIFSEIDGFFPNLLNIHEKKKQTNKQTKTKKKAWKGYFFYIACKLRLFAHSSSSPKRKY